jgi:hypothetical protein
MQTFEECFGLRLALVEADTWEHRIYSDDYANQYAIVDKEDYLYLIQWRWKLKESKAYGNNTPKIYLARSGHETLGPISLIDGKKKRNRVCSTIFLHQEVMRRKGVPKPISNEKLIIDHANSNSLDCRRNNLRWATVSFNNKNKFGKCELTLFDMEMV